MNRLVKSDFRKLFAGKAFWVCSVITLALGAFIIFTYFIAGAIVDFSMSSGALSANDMLELQVADIMIPSSVWGFVSSAFGDGSVSLMIAIMLAIFITGEYNGTYKNAVARGFSRTTIYLSKVLVSMAVMVIFLVIYIGINIVLSYAIWGEWGSVSAGTIILTLLIDFVEYIAMTAFIAMLAVVFRTTGVMIAVTLAITMLLPTLLAVLSLAMNDWPILQFWISYMPEYTETFINDNQAWLPFVVSAVYIAVSLAVGTVVFRKADLK